MYRTFTRCWWRKNPSWPNKLEPHMGRKRTRGYYNTEQEAKQACKEYNDTHNPGKYSVKMEYETI